MKEIKHLSVDERTALGRMHASGPGVGSCAVGAGRWIGRIRSRWSRSRTRPVRRIWCRCVTGA